MRTETFIIHAGEQKIKECSLNRIYAGSHWTVRRKKAHFFHELTATEIKAQCTPKIFETPVNVTIWYNTCFDIDNHSYMSKMIIDGMKGLFIENDTRKYVKSLTQGFHNGSKDEIFVEVEACNTVE